MAGTTVEATSVLPTWSAEYRAIAELNKLVTDVETLRAALSTGGVTAVIELMADHATNKTLLDELKSDFNLLRGNFINGCDTAVGLAEGTNANTLKTAATAQYHINGQRYTKAATDNIAMTAAAEQAISTYCLYLVSVVANGDVTVTKGTEQATDIATFPSLPANSAPIGGFKVATDGATTFTSGTDDLSTAGLTVTYYDLAYVNSGADASTAIAASSAATLTASAPSSTAVDTAGDLTAAKIDSLQFEAEIV